MRVFETKGSKHVMFITVVCNETVNIIEAILFGSDDACIDVGLASMLGGVALFIGSVLVLRYIGISILRRILPSLRRKKSNPHIAAETPPEDRLLRMPYESPIRSTGAWGRKLR